MSPRQTQPPSKTQPQDPAEKDPDFEAILSLAHSVNRLHLQIADTCAPVVREMIRSQTQDRRQIEHMLDRLLDCACIPEGLTLFRALCRYYYAIDPAATASYVHAYREMWDTDDLGKEAIKWVRVQDMGNKKGSGHG